LNTLDGSPGRSGSSEVNAYRVGISGAYQTHSEQASQLHVSTLFWVRHHQVEKRAETFSCFLQQFENTVVLRRTFIHLISSSVVKRTYYFRTPCISTNIIPNEDRIALCRVASVFIGLTPLINEKILQFH
jgi:hypothetical protein